MARFSSMRLHLGVGDRGQLGHDGAQRIVEPNRSFVLRQRRSEARGGQSLRMHQVAQVPKRQFGGRLGPPASFCGRATPSTERTLSRLKRPAARSDAQMRQVIDLLRDLGVGPSRSIGDSEVLDQPCPQRRRAALSPVLATIQLGRQHRAAPASCEQRTAKAWEARPISALVPSRDTCAVVMGRPARAVHRHPKQSPGDQSTSTGPRSVRRPSSSRHCKGERSSRASECVRRIWLCDPMLVLDEEERRS